MTKKILVTISEDGTSSIDLEGFKGQGCQKVIDDFMAGDKPSLVRAKPEYYQSDKQGVKQHG